MNLLSNHDTNPMADILAYLERGPCNNCEVDKVGNYAHCEKCMNLFQRALIAAKDLNKKPTWQQKKEIEAAKVTDDYEMKMSHNWARSANISGGKMQPYPSHCKSCGIDYTLHKAKPFFCPKKA